MHLLLLLVIILLVIAFAKGWLRGKPQSPDIWPFETRATVMSALEQVLHQRLVEALPGHLVLAQVQASRVLQVRSGYKDHEWIDRINQFSYDYVVCSKDSTPLAAIELDDGGRASVRRIDADLLKDKASAAAGLRMIRWHVEALPDGADIRRAVLGPAEPHL